MPFFTYATDTETRTIESFDLAGATAYAEKQPGTLIGVIKAVAPKLISRDDSAADNEPQGVGEYSRDTIRNTVRACLLRRRELAATLLQVHKVSGFSKDVTALASFFYSHEAA